MKISKVIEILELENEAKFNKYDYVYEYNESVNNNGINYCQFDTISNNKIIKEEDKYSALKKVKKYISSNIENEENIYYSIYSLLYSIGKWKQLSDGNFDINNYISNNIEMYVNKLKCFIINNLDFSQIKGMSTLISKVKNDRFYKYLMFNVTKYDYALNSKGYKNYNNTTKYCFGNIKFCEDMDEVSISIYDDYFELYFSRKGSTFKNYFNNKNGQITIEQRILEVINYWNDYFMN